MNNAPDNTISTQTSTTIYKKKPYDIFIVFGIGPIKAVLLPEQVTPQQFREYDVFVSDTSKYPEPNFWIMQNPRKLAQIKKIRDRFDISDLQKDKLLEQEIQAWQHQGHYALKRLAKQNALAAGMALYKGLTKEIILTGGKTMSPWAKKYLPKERLDSWPSEAELMAEIIINTYGDLYKKKYAREINEVMHIEDHSTNTLENFAYSINRYPILNSSEKSIGFLSSGYHMKRLYLLADIFSIHISDDCLFSAQEILQDDNTYEHTEIVDTNNSIDAKMLSKQEARFIKALRTPEYVSYWLGYVAEVKKAYILQHAINRLHKKEWKEAGVAVLKQVKIDAEEVFKTDLELLAKTSPEKYVKLVESLVMLKHPSYRSIPPDSLQ